jgi:hypothetical protein
MPLITSKALLRCVLGGLIHLWFEVPYSYIVYQMSFKDFLLRFRDLSGGNPFKGFA